MRTQTIVWTALPNGTASPGQVHLSVFVAPQLQTNEGGSYPPLSLFPDWVDWPQTMQTSKLSFEVDFQGYGSILVDADVAGTDPARWQALFDPTKTGVTTFTYEDYSTTPIHSFSVSEVATYMKTTYGALGATSPSIPVVLSAKGTALYPDPPNPAASAFLNLEIARTPVSAVRAFHTRPVAPTAPYVPELPTLDFHQAASALGSYPAVLRTLGLAFDLVVPLPSALVSSTTDVVINISVLPQWTSAFAGTGGDATVNVSPMTNCRLTPSTFRAVPVGPDYGNGMLDLADTTRFSVVDLDVDGASEQFYNFLQSVTNLGAWLDQHAPDNSTTAMTVPALRSIGPSIVWSGWGTAGSGLNALATRQTNINTAVQQWVTWYLEATPGSTEPALPVLQAEDIIRGHRFDVSAVGQPGTTWRSLHQRKGRYVFGTTAPVSLPPTGDEGIVVPGATTAAGTNGSPPPDLYVHESIARWAGWSLSAPRPGPRIDPNDTVNAHPTNPAPTAADGAGQITPRLSAEFTVVPGTLPKLRFGQSYSYRARAVDLAGNSLPPSSNDASTATPPVPHYRYEPVASPVITPTAELVPGEAVLLLALRNFQTPSMPVAPNGRWLFPPKASELLAEEHGMLDGFVQGHAPNPLAPPADNHATYKMLAGTGPTKPGRVDAELVNLPGVKSDPNQGTPYIPSTALPNTPWLPDPLSSGVTLVDLTSDPIVIPWSGVPWPNADPLLLLVQPGTGNVTQSYQAATASTPPTETVTLPPGVAVDIVVSSALTGTETLGVFQWMLQNPTGATEAAQLQALALNGQVWMLSPYRGLRLVHAVRLPLVAPQMPNPAVTRTLGSLQATITDKDFILSAESTADIDVEATWTDPLDDPSDPTNDPATAQVTTMGHAFKVNVPDPVPLTATAQPMEIFPPGSAPVNTTPFVHTLGNTQHHLVSYTCTATSRFAEFFRASATSTLQGTMAVTIGTLGLDPATVVVTVDGSPPGPELVQSSDGVTGDYTVNGAAGTISLLSTSPYSKDKPFEVIVSYVPTDTVTGPPVAVHILSTAVPKTPKVVKVTPAWSLDEPSGPLTTQLSYSRVGGYLRVYLERPWFSSGANELLGVVGYTGTLPSSVDPSWVTMMGLDPISVSSLTTAYPAVPAAFGASATDWPTVVANRPTTYSSPPSIPLLEDPGTPMQIWPYDVHYDPVSGYWYADVNVSAGWGSSAGPPPGYFVRLALVRFQPYSIVGAEISSVTLATFAQPVANRSVSVTANSMDPTNKSVLVSVSGPGYYGWRPPDPATAAVQLDNPNPSYSLHPYSGGGAEATSTMIVEVQTLDTTSGLSGELAWVAAPGTSPVMLRATFPGANQVSWSLSGSESVALPAALGSTTSMRLRISELDYYPFYEGGSTPVTPAAVNTSFRRPFVALIPIN
jgi:hypothetical protein